MKRERISNNVIRRLPMYLRKLDDLIYNGVDRISSGELGKQMALTPSQIRQDFSCFGEFGQQGYGYRVQELRDQVARILGVNKHFNIAIVGVGNLGHTLIENMGFEEMGFKVSVAFDLNPEKIGTKIGEVPVLSSDYMAEWLTQNPTDIVVLTVPSKVAKATAELVVGCGVRAVWNFTNIDLELNKAEVSVENIHFSDSLLTLSYYLNDSRTEKNTKA